MIGNNVDMIIGDEVDEIERLLTELESWSSEIFCNDWRLIENSGSTSSEYYEQEHNVASARNYERLLAIEKLREKLLCHG